MSEHIKTGERIVKDWLESQNGVGHYEGVVFQGQWVSLSWLKEQIKQLQEKDKLREYTYKNVLSLLEEKL